jgi:hypothetical protein
MAAAVPDTIPIISPPTSWQCCNVVVPSSTPGATAVAHFFGLQISGLGVDVGLGCSPLTVTGNNWLVLRFTVTCWGLMYLVLWQRGERSQLRRPRQRVGRRPCHQLPSIDPGLKQRECYRNNISPCSDSTVVSLGHISP